MMKNNFEFYKQEIDEITMNGYAIAIIEDEITICDPEVVNCTACQFYKSYNCTIARRNWLMSPVELLDEII